MLVDTCVEKGGGGCAEVYVSFECLGNNKYKTKQQINNNTIIYYKIK